MSELTRIEFERTLIQLPVASAKDVDAAKAISLNDAALRHRIEELEHVLRLHLAVSQDDPLLIEPPERQVLKLEQQLAQATQERNELKVTLAKARATIYRAVADEFHVPHSVNPDDVVNLARPICAQIEAVFLRRAHEADQEPEKKS